MIYYRIRGLCEKTGIITRKSTDKPEYKRCDCIFEEEIG